MAIPKVCPWPSDLPFHFERVAGDATSDGPARIQACVAQRLAGGGRQPPADGLSYRVPETLGTGTRLREPKIWSPCLGELEFNLVTWRPGHRPGTLSLFHWHMGPCSSNSPSGLGDSRAERLNLLKAVIL